MCRPCAGKLRHGLLAARRIASAQAISGGCETHGQRLWLTLRSVVTSPMWSAYALAVSKDPLVSISKSR